MVSRPCKWKRNLIDEMEGEGDGGKGLPVSGLTYRFSPTQTIRPSGLWSGSCAAASLVSGSQTPIRTECCHRLFVWFAEVSECRDIN